MKTKSSDDGERGKCSSDDADDGERGGFSECSDVGDDGKRGGLSGCSDVGDGSGDMISTSRRVGGDSAKRCRNPCD